MAFKPADGVEGMMAAQAAGLHAASMGYLRRAMMAEQPAQASDQLRRQRASQQDTTLDISLRTCNELYAAMANTVRRLARCHTEQISRRNRDCSIFVWTV